MPFHNPITFGFGLGKGFEEGLYSVSLYYQRYSKIYPIYNVPNQLSFGFYFNPSGKIYVSLVGSKGFSETTPDYTVSTGLEYYIK